MKNWSISFDFDCEGEPPTVFIEDVDGTAWVEVYEEPTISPSVTDVDSDGNPWSWEPEDWTAGPIAQQIVEIMNANIKPEAAQ